LKQSELKSTSIFESEGNRVENSNIFSRIVSVRNLNKFSFRKQIIKFKHFSFTFLSGTRTRLLSQALSSPLLLVSSMLVGLMMVKWWLRFPF
jgi:hypothetical protein